MRALVRRLLETCFPLALARSLPPICNKLLIIGAAGSNDFIDAPRGVWIDHC
jgi:hypothetical protein